MLQNYRHLQIYQATAIVSSLKETLFHFASSLDENLVLILLKEIDHQLSIFSDHFPKSRQKRMIYRLDQKNQVDVSIKGTLFSVHSLFGSYELIIQPAFLQFINETIEIPEGLHILAINDKKKSQKSGKTIETNNSPKQKRKQKIYSSSKDILSNS